MNAAAMAAEIAADTARISESSPHPLPTPADQSFVALGQPADVAVILVNYNTGHLIERCIAHLRAASVGLRVRVIIVDNASRDASAELVRERLPDCVLVANDTNVGFGRANNQVLPLCEAPYVLLLNVDAFVSPDALAKCLRYMQAHPRCGVLGARLTNEAGTSTYAGRNFPAPWPKFKLQVGLQRTPLDPRHPDDAPAPPGGAWTCDWVVGCFYMVRREVLDQIGLFDPRYFLYFEEVDHCLRVTRSGWTVECLADARVLHVGGASAESEGALTNGRQLSALQIESELLYFRKHGGWPSLIATVVLAVAADAIQGLKWILKGRGFAGLATFWRNTATTCRLALQTRFGTRATR